MEFMPHLEIGWLNGWLAVVLLGLTEGIFFLVFPREVVKRLFDRSGVGYSFIFAGGRFLLLRIQLVLV